MKKFFSILMLCLVILLYTTSCTENQRAKHFGGTMKIIVPQGQSVVMATFKESNLWYLTEPMDSTYQPKTKILQEHSPWGLVEGKVYFIESK